MKRNYFAFPFLLALVLFISVTEAFGHNVPTAKTKAEQLRSNMHKLWEDHITWTRNVILNIMDDLPGTDQAVTRLLRNQDDIGNTITPLYGDAAGNELTRLLREHITLAADLLKAAKANNQTQFNDINKKWTDNADAIAAFLSKA